MYIIACILGKYFWKDIQNTKCGYLFRENWAAKVQSTEVEFLLYLLYNLNFILYVSITYANNREK